MKIAKMVIGILSILLFAVIVFQSCAAGIYNALDENEEVSGTAGMFVAFGMLAAGIIGLAARKSFGGSITAGCFYLLAGIIALAGHGSFGDLVIWGVLSLLFAAFFIVGSIIERSVKAKAQSKEPQPAGGADQ